MGRRLWVMKGLGRDLEGGSAPVAVRTGLFVSFYGTLVYMEDIGANAPQVLYGLAVGNRFRGIHGGVGVRFLFGFAIFLFDPDAVSGKRNMELKKILLYLCPGFVP